MKLVDHIRIYENFAGRNEKAVVNAKLNELCVKPFREQIGGMTNIPTIEVSSEYHNLRRRVRILFSYISHFIHVDMPYLQPYTRFFTRTVPSLTFNLPIRYG